MVEKYLYFIANLQRKRAVVGSGAFPGLLRGFEIVFNFPKQVLQIIFLILFGSSYHYQICHRNKRNIIDSLYHIYFRKHVTMATI